MTIDIVIRAEDFYTNKIYFIREKGRWHSMLSDCTPTALSNYCSNGAELYIALENCETKSDAIRAINKYANYLKKNSAQ